MSTPTQVLVIQHEDSCPPGWVGPWLTEAGAELSVIRAWERSSQVPQDLAAYDGLVVLGGEMDATADAGHPWLPGTRALLAQAVSDRIPTLGICLGFQLTAVALGGRVGKNPAGPRRGITQVVPGGRAIGDPLFGTLPNGALAVHYNYDIAVELPPGADVLAATDDGAPQIVRFAPQAWGVQFHPEVGPEIFNRWTIDKPAEKVPSDYGFDARASAAAVATARESLIATWRPVVQTFAQLLSGGDPPGASPSAQRGSAR